MNPPGDLLPAVTMREVYALTPAGANELGQGMTTLSAAQLELLVRFDGALALTQIKAAMPTVSDEVFATTFRNLQDRRLVALVTNDLVEMKLQAQLDKFSLAETSSKQADAGMLSLRRAGYFVEIARGQAAPVPRAVDAPIVALVVEDEPVLAKFVKTYLSFEGIEVRLAANGAEVREELAKPRLPDIVLLDVVLPDADGFNILRQLRGHSEFKNVPVIMLTGKATRESVIEGIAGGASGYLTKPFQADSLVRAVRTVLGLPVAAAAADAWTNSDAKCMKWQLKATA